MASNKKTQNQKEFQEEITSEMFYKKNGYCFDVTKNGIAVNVNRSSAKGLNFIIDFMLRRMKNGAEVEIKDVVNLLGCLYDLITLVHNDLNVYKMTTKLCLDNVCDKLGFNEWCEILNKEKEDGKD